MFLDKRNNFKKLNDDKFIKNMQGKGLLGGVPLLEGEKHMPQFINGKLTNSNFLGPGTKILERERLGRDYTTPINKLDSLAKAHDYDYYNAVNKYKKDNDRSAFLNEVKRTDREFINKSKNEGFVGKLASNAIGLKSIAEAANIIPTTLFSGAGKNKEDPTYELKKKIMIEKRKSKNKNIEIKPEEQDGGFLPLAVIATTLLGTVASKGLDLLIDKFIKPQTGSGLNLTKQQKINLLINKVPLNDLVPAAKQLKKI